MKVKKSDWELLEQAPVVSSSTMYYYILDLNKRLEKLERKEMKR